MNEIYRPAMLLAAERTLDLGFLVGGPLVEEFENAFSEYIGAGSAIGVGNGLDALCLALEAWGIGPGDEVIVPAFTFYASWLAVVKTGATLVPVDVKSADATLDPELISSKISSNTKVILVVHLFGHAADMVSILRIAREHDLLVLEDAAQAHGCFVDSKRVGALGDAAAFSFYPTKNLGAVGDGGAITTSDTETAEIVRSKRSYGATTDKFTFELIGRNSRLDPLQASFLTERLKALDAGNLHRQEVAARYYDALGSGVGRVIGPTDVTASVWHLFVVETNDRSSFRTLLRNKGVSTDFHYPYWIGEIGTLKSHLKQGLMAEEFPNSRRLAHSVVSLPIGPWILPQEIEIIESALSAMSERNQSLEWPVQ